MAVNSDKVFVGLGFGLLWHAAYSYRHCKCFFLSFSFINVLYIYFTASFVLIYLIFGSFRHQVSRSN